MPRRRSGVKETAADGSSHRWELQSLAFNKPIDSVGGMRMATRKKTATKNAPVKKIDHEEGKVVRINRNVPSDMRSAFSNHFVVRHTASGEFHLYFFEIDPPIRLGEAGENDFDEVDAKCVAKVVVTKETMGSIIAAMAENFSKRMAQEQTSAKESSGEESTKTTKTTSKTSNGEKHAG